MSEQMKPKYKPTDPLGMDWCRGQKQFVYDMVGEWRNAIDSECGVIVKDIPPVYIGVDYASGPSIANEARTWQSMYIDMLKDQEARLAADMQRIAKQAEKLPEAKPIGPRKPTPALPVEVYSQTAFDSDRAHEALMALCRGS